MATAAFILGLLLYALVRIGFGSPFYTVKQNERAVITTFGRAQRATQGESEIHSGTDGQVRYRFPRLRVIGPGGPHLLMPWNKVHKISIATQTIDIAKDPHYPEQRQIEAVTKDNLTIGIGGQIRYRVSESNLYPYLFGIDDPEQHLLGFFISVLRQEVAVFQDPKQRQVVEEIEGIGTSPVEEPREAVSINDLRRNLSLINEHMERECGEDGRARYGIELEAALITSIDPPTKIDQALSQIHSMRNQVAADLSQAQAEAEQAITLSQRAVEIADNNARSEVEPLRELARVLKEIKEQGGKAALYTYLRNLRIPLLENTKRIVETRGPRQALTAESE